MTVHFLWANGWRWHLEDPFEDLDLESIDWSLEELPASELTEVSHHDTMPVVGRLAANPHGELAKRREKGL